MFYVIIIAALIAWTITEHVVKSDLFEFVRKKLTGIPFFGQVVNCPVCFGQWASWFAYGTTKALFYGVPGLWPFVGEVFLMGFAVYYLARILADLSDLLYSKTLDSKVPKVTVNPGSSPGRD